MPIGLYMDQHVPRSITVGLRLRGIDVITAYEDGCSELDDPALLSRAGILGRILFTCDDDLLAEAADRQEKGIRFQGVVYAHQMKISIGDCIHDLELIAKLGTAEELKNGVIFLPL